MSAEREPEIAEPLSKRYLREQVVKQMAPVYAAFADSAGLATEKRRTLIDALVASKSWMRGYAEAFVDDAVDLLSRDGEQFADAWARLQQLASDEHNATGEHFQEGGDLKNCPDVPEWARLVAAMAAPTHAFQEQSAAPQQDPAAMDMATAILWLHSKEGSDDGNGPGHAHSKPGIWDDDNGAKSGTQCEWCAMWRLAYGAAAAIGRSL